MIFPLFVIPKRFERLTHALEGRCSIQLSYGTSLMFYDCKDSAFVWLYQEFLFFFVVFFATNAVVIFFFVVIIRRSRILRDCNRMILQQIGQGRDVLSWLVGLCHADVR